MTNKRSPGKSCRAKGRTERQKPISYGKLWAFLGNRRSVQLVLLGRSAKTMLYVVGT